MMSKDAWFKRFQDARMTWATNDNIFSFASGKYNLTFGIYLVIMPNIITYKNQNRNDFVWSG